MKNCTKLFIQFSFHLWDSYLASVLQMVETVDMQLGSFSMLGSRLQIPNSARQKKALHL